MSGIDRLKEHLLETGQIGRSEPVRTERFDQLNLDLGVSRPTGTEANRKIRDYTVQCMREAGLKIEVDAAGNIFGRREGSKTSSGSVMCGSHVDSVKRGGMFDGALGVFAAIEALMRLQEEHFENERPLEVAVFTGEEGSAFKQVLFGSSILTGKISLEEALGMKNEGGQTLQQALEDIGYRGETLRSLDDVEYMIEMHVEQGPVLYQERVPVGIVENITGLIWIMVRITGQENHAGTTPMKMRKDALVTASEVVSFVNRRANEMVDTYRGSTVGTVGKLNVFPNGTNTVPGRVEMGIDIRDVDRGRMKELTQETLDLIKTLEERYGVRTEVELPAPHDPVPLSREVIAAIEASAEKVGIAARRMNSGAGHDAQNIAERVKTGMIFVPSLNGVSHSPLEWTEWQDIEKGVLVLTQTIKELSRL